MPSLRLALVSCHQAQLSIPVLQVHTKHNGTVLQTEDSPGFPKRHIYGGFSQFLDLKLQIHSGLFREGIFLEKSPELDHRFD